MSEQASNVAREAKGLQQGLKDILKTREPWDKEVDFQRKNLRRRYLSLLLVHPYAKESKDIETHLWMQTSYAFISSYKTRISTLDRAIQSTSRQQHQGQQQQPRHSGHGPVEYRKLMQRFRQFLSDEEKFWTQLVVRFRRSFSLNEAHPALVALGILSTADDAPAPIPLEASEPKDGGIPASNGRNHFQFPPEDGAISVAPTTAAERDGRLAILSKALVCLGDIARYRELYNESGGRPKAGHEDAAPRRGGRRGRGGSGGLDSLPRARNYDKAQQCYEWARLLVPYDGNPSHQLGILASYQKDTFGSLVHYYRALCVRQPYDTALENLGTVLTKALDQWKSRSKRERDTVPDPEHGRPPIVRIEAFKEKTVVLHAFWRLGTEKWDLISLEQAQGACEDFKSLVAERSLPIDMLSKVIVLSQGALWKHRMINDPATSVPNKKSTSTPHPSIPAAVIESRIFAHLLSLHQSLLEVGLIELAEPMPRDAAENDLAQQITATFRRTLPALRIASKWLRGNFKYVMQCQESDGTRDRDNGKGKGPGSNRKKEHKTGGFSSGVPQFWDTYSRFSCALVRAFPVERLPVLDAPLEEDIEMRGFLPLRKMMGEAKTSEDQTGRIAVPQIQAQEQVHPNVEQLMRIADLLADAKAIVEMENSPIALYGNRFVLKGIEAKVPADLIGVKASVNSLEDSLPVPQQQLLDEIRNDRLILLEGRELEDDTMTETTSRTDDDPVRDAFRQALDGSDHEVEEEEEEDQIVWDPRATLSPVMTVALPSPPLRPAPITPVRSSMSPIGPSARSPTHPKGITPFTTPIAMTTAPMATTAQDLLNKMGLSRTVSGGDLSRALPHPAASSAPQPPLLFGSGPPNRPGHSIWSTSLDDQSLKFVAGASQSGHLYQSNSQQFSGPSSQDLSQSIWSSSYPNASQNSQINLVGALPSAPFAPQPHPTLDGGHQRAPSSSIPAGHMFAGQNHGPLDPFGYSPVMPQHIAPRLDSQHTPLPASYSQMAPNSGFYGQGPLHNYHNRHLSLHHDPRVGQVFAPPPLSPVWGGTG